MEATFKVTEPEAVSFTLTVTMRLDQWNRVAEMLRMAEGSRPHSEHIPEGMLYLAIRDMVRQARTSFLAEPEETDA